MSEPKNHLIIITATEDPEVFIVKKPLEDLIKDCRASFNHHFLYTLEPSEDQPINSWNALKLKRVHKNLPGFAFETQILKASHLLDGMSIEEIENLLDRATTIFDKVLARAKGVERAAEQEG